MIGSICRYLDINALTIPRGKLEEARRRREMQRAERKMMTKKKNQPGDSGARTTMTDGNASARLEGRKLGPDGSVLMVQKEMNGTAGRAGSDTDSGQIGEKQKENKKMR